MRLFLYNVFHVPMLITLIWSIRRLLIDESFKSTAFLWIPVIIYIYIISLYLIWILHLLYQHLL